MNKYKNIKVTVSTIHDCQKDIKQLFFDILEDYSNRFGVQVTDRKMNVHICLIEYSEETPSQGLTVYSEDTNRILIQTRDPYLNNWEDNSYTLAKFSDILCHEFVHACQSLTGRKGFKIKGLKYDKSDEREVYFFDPEEMEARVLEGPYSMLYAQKLLFP